MLSDGESESCDDFVVGGKYSDEKSIKRDAFEQKGVDFGEKPVKRAEFLEKKEVKVDSVFDPSTLNLIDGDLDFSSCEDNKSNRVSEPKPDPPSKNNAKTAQNSEKLGKNSQAIKKTEKVIKAEKMTKKSKKEAKKQ